MGRQEAESLYDWFEKTFDIVGALGDRWPNAGDVLDAARRGARAMAEREYYCVDCGRIHVASLWYVRQVNEVGRPLMKTDYLCGEAHSHLGQALLEKPGPRRSPPPDAPAGHRRPRPGR